MRKAFGMQVNKNFHLVRKFFFFYRINIFFFFFFFTKNINLLVFLWTNKNVAFYENFLSESASSDEIPVPYMCSFCVCFLLE